MSKVLQMVEDLQKKIQNGEYKEGDKLPTEMEFCEIYSLSRMTVRKALEKLIDNGWLYRVQGSGNYVSKDVSRVTYVEDSNSLGLTQYMKGKKVDSKILKLEIMKASSRLATKIKCNENEELYYVERVRYIDNEPQIIEHTYFLKKYVCLLNEEILKGSIYNHIENILGYKIQKSTNVITTKNCTEREADILQCSPGDAVIVSDSTVYFDNGNVFEFSKNYHKGEHASFVLIRTRN